MLEGARTEYLGEQWACLALNSLNSWVSCRTLDSSKYDIFITPYPAGGLPCSATTSGLLHRAGMMSF